MPISEDIVRSARYIRDIASFLFQLGIFTQKQIQHCFSYANLFQRRSKISNSFSSEICCNENMRGRISHATRALKTSKIYRKPLQLVQQSFKSTKPFVQVLFFIVSLPIPSLFDLLLWISLMLVLSFLSLLLSPNLIFFSFEKKNYGRNF